MLLLTRLELHLRINNNNTLRKCTLLDWGGTEEVVAEGRWSSNDLKATVHHVPPVLMLLEFGWTCQRSQMHFYGDLTQR
ncbi:importin subunit beta-3-like [Cucumis melo var. makuwa]|uniref:Importin subunit beta-3-like n=1 Tax=Cucumis melo var. makuwa TaxID=1194695 RepID=A0A5A7TTE6_CUCMM|nr:importin subunit beta-3-like [Cucumis melo var. makuwa]